MADPIEIHVKKGTDYEIVLENDFSRINEKFSSLNLGAGKICIVTDSQVAPIYLEEVKKELEQPDRDVLSYVFPCGENSKNLNTVQEVYEFLIENHFSRNDCLIALGGGVVGDLTGYAAATYLRGISFIQVPTTLLAMVDSSIGGKTGVDFKGYKNMIGAFHMPRLVYINIKTIETLEERQFYSGFAEAMKSALIKDAIFYEWLIDNMYEICDRDLDICSELVLRSLAVKKMIVEKDPYENGDRMLLNLGHTIGHAIEKYKNFQLLHGECVALGCVAAAFISYKKEMLSMEEYYEIRDMFVPFCLPISIEDIDENRILEYTKSDKKMENSHIRFILLKKIGRAVIDETVTDEEIINAVKEITYTDEME